MAVPDVSVVITFFREEDLLKETIESALSQTYSRTELVLVDNNASPGTRKIAQGYAGRYPLTVRLVCEPVQGVAASKNRGVQESRGEFVAMLDGDDLMHPDRISLQKAAMEERPGCALVSSWYDRVSLDNREVVRKDVARTEPLIWLETQKILQPLFPASRALRRGQSLHFPLVSTAFFRRNTALTAGGFDNAFNPRWFEDIEFFVRMYEYGTFFKVPRALVRYRISSPEAMELKESQMDWVGICRQMDLFYRMMAQRYGRLPDAGPVFRRLRALWLLHASHHFFRHGEGTALGRKMLRRALWATPGDPGLWKLLLKSFAPREFHPRLFWFREMSRGPFPEEATAGFVDSLFRDRAP